jgi:cytochrome c5
MARPTGIEPVSRASETLILSIELRAPKGDYTLCAGLIYLNEIGVFRVITAIIPKIFVIATTGRLMSNQTENKETVHAEDHEMIIKTPKQLIVTVVLSFVIPVVVLIMLASWVTTGDRKAAGSDALGPEATALRIAPVAKLEIVEATAAAQVRSGEQVYNLACAACHVAGVAGAPKFADQVAWAGPIATGLQAMVDNVIKGKGAMPARGGNPNLSDAEIANAVVYVANASGGNFPEVNMQAPAEATLQVAAAKSQEAKDARTDAGAPALPQATTNTPQQLAAAESKPVDLALGERIYNQACVACHRSGVAGAPKFGDKAAWAPYVATGMDTMIELAIKGKGLMPARGGMASASDADIAAAVHYMVQAVQ